MTEESAPTGVTVVRGQGPALNLPKANAWQVSSDGHLHIYWGSTASQVACFAPGTWATVFSEERAMDRTESTPAAPAAASTPVPTAASPAAPAAAPAATPAAAPALSSVGAKKDQDD